MTNYCIRNITEKDFDKTGLINPITPLYCRYDGDFSIENTFVAVDKDDNVLAFGRV